MANEVATMQSASMMQGLARNPVARQLLLLAGVAAAVAVGVAVAMWSLRPSYQPLYSGLAHKDASQVIDALQKSGIAHKLDAATGAVLVPAAQIYDARIKLAAQGLPKGGDSAVDLLQEQGVFGASAMLESARHQRALETELARSIAALNTVQSARVHLGLPKSTAFGRDRQPATASILVNLYAGQTLDDSQVAAVVHLVASSVPNLDSNRVTIVDQRGRLLTAPSDGRDAALSYGQLDYTRKLEANYIKRVEELLTPIVGAGAVRAQVVTDVDFTFTEQTEEKFNPAQTALRSEQVAQEQNNGGGGLGGVPGALSNQPPGAATVPEVAAGADTATSAATPTPSSSSNRATRNFELDKTVSHTRLGSGVVKRLSVAVVLDDRQKLDENGELTRTPFTPEELERLTALVKDAVGFNAQRGDSVNVMNIAFNAPGEVGEEPDTPIWRQTWVWDVAKQVGAGLLVLFLIFGILRPTMRGLLAARPAPQLTGDQMSEAYAGGMPLLPGGNYDQQLSAAKGLASQDPTRVAQVVKNWVGNDG